MNAKRMRSFCGQSTVHEESANTKTCRGQSSPATAFKFAANGTHLIHYVVEKMLSIRVRAKEASELSRINFPFPRQSFCSSEEKRKQNEDENCGAGAPLATRDAQPLRLLFIYQIKCVRDLRASFVRRIFRPTRETATAFPQQNQLSFLRSQALKESSLILLSGIFSLSMKPISIYYLVGGGNHFPPK